MKMKNKINAFLLTILFCTLSSHVKAYSVADTVYKVDEVIPSYIIPSSEATLSKISKKSKAVGNDRNILELVLSLNENTTAVLVDTLTDFAGGYHESYKEYYNGIEVEGTRCTIHYDQSGNITSINGNFRTISDLNTVPSITEDVALRSALSDIGSEKYAWEDAGSEQMLKSLKGNPNATNYPRGRLVIYAEKNNFSIAYKFCIRSILPESYYDVYIDAEKGTVLGKYSSINEYASTDSVATVYSGRQTITSDYYSGSYRLRDYTRGNGIETYKYMSSNYQVRTDYISTNNTWSGMSLFDRAALDVHWGLEKTYDFYLNKFGRNSCDNMGGKIVSFVNKSGLDNAFFSGTDTVIVFGNKNNNPIVDLDIVAHEMTHAVTFFTSHLGNQGESGALNEALSDVFAIGVENEVKPNGGQLKWIYCDNPYISQHSRNMQNPICKFYHGIGWVNGTNSGAHINLGVFSYWFYLLANGGSGTNEVGDDYDVLGIGLDHALRICYLMNTAYLTSNSDYIDACRCSYLAAEQLGYTDEIEQIREAWIAVGVQYFLEASIDGQSVLCTNYNNNYYILNIPSAYNVSWMISGVDQWNYDPTSLNHYCHIMVVNCDANSNAILNAEISYNNKVIKTISKKLFTHNNELQVSGLQEEYRDEYSNYYPEQTFSYTALNAANGYSSSQISINEDCDIYLTSNRFRGMDISFEGNSLPTNVSHIDNCVSFHTSLFSLPPLAKNGQTRLGGGGLIPLSYPLTMNVSSTCGYKDFTLNFTVSSIPYLNDVELTINVNGNNLNIFFSEATPIPIGGGLYQQVNWQLNILNAQTLQTVFSQSVVGNSITVNIGSWPSGLYIIHAIYDGVTHSAKFSK